jgi:hypothetical protein
MRHYLKKISSFLLPLMFVVSAIAGTTNKTSLMPAGDVVSDVQQVITSVSEKSSIPVLFPAVVPAPENLMRLYASGRSVVDNPDYNKYWTITVDATKDCGGMHTCNVGALTAARGMKLDKNYLTLPDQKSHKKERVKLEGGYIGYYTPFHTEASGVNPTIEWQVKDVLYTLQWRIIDAEAKDFLIVMVNSAVKASDKAGE